MVERFSKILILATLILNSKQALSSDPVGGSGSAPQEVTHSLKRKFDPVTTVRADAGDFIKALQAQVALLQAQYAQSQYEVARLRAKVAQLQAQNTRFQNDAARLEGFAYRQGRALEAADETRRDLEVRIAGLEREIECLNRDHEKGTRRWLAERGRLIAENKRLRQLPRAGSATLAAASIAPVALAPDARPSSEPLQ